MGEGSSNPEGNTPRAKKPWGEAMYKVAKAELEKATIDPDYFLDPDRETYMRDQVERYEKKRRGAIESVLSRLDAAVEGGYEEDVSMLRDWLDGKNRDGVSNAKPTEIIDIMLSRSKQAEALIEAPSVAAAAPPPDSSNQAARKELVFPTPDLRVRSPETGSAELPPLISKVTFEPLIYASSPNRTAGGNTLPQNPSPGVIRGSSQGK